MTGELPHGEDALPGVQDASAQHGEPDARGTRVGRGGRSGLRKS